MDPIHEVLLILNLVSLSCKFNVFQIPNVNLEPDPFHVSEELSKGQPVLAVEATHIYHVFFICLQLAQVI